VPSRIPPGAIGGFGGALGTLPLLSAARTLASRFVSPPELPGAEKLTGDVKAATFAEAAVLLVVLPAAALFFGAIVPRWLERRTPARGLSFEWIGLGFAFALPIWRRGATTRAAFLSGIALALLAGALVHLSRSHRLLARRMRALKVESFGPLLVAAAAWELGRRASSGPAAGSIGTLSLAALLAALPFLLLPRARSARSPARP
jgi:hypothetical protein